MERSVEGKLKNDAIHSPEADVPLRIFIHCLMPGLVSGEPRVRKLPSEPHAAIDPEIAIIKHPRPPPCTCSPSSLSSPSHCSG